MTRGDEHALVAKHIDASLFVVDSMPIPLSPAWQCLRAALVRVRFELGQVEKESKRAAL